MVGFVWNRGPQICYGPWLLHIVLVSVFVDLVSVASSRFWLPHGRVLD
jgi:hypothetical protein